MEHKTISLKLKVWKQKNSQSSGRFETYEAKNISTEMSFLEMFDVLNEELIKEGKEHNQAVGYLDDGTMVVVEEARRFIGQEIKVVVTSVLQTQAGRMIFTKIEK